MTGIKIPVEAAFATGSADDAIKAFQEQFNKLGETIARANKLKFTPVDKASVENIKQVNAGFNSLLKVSGDFSKRLKATGQAGAGFLDVDWSKLYPDKNVQARQMHKAFDYVTGGGHLTPLLPAAPAPAPQPGPQPAPAPAQVPPHHPTAEPPSQVAKVARAGLNATGFGGAANSAISEGMQFGAMAGLAGLAGGLAALAVGKIISSVREKLGAAQQESIGYDTLKRTLGDVNVSFSVLRESLRETARGLDMTFDEALRHGTTFTKLAGLTGEQHKTVGEEVQNAGGFARSFGMDPGQAVGFFGQARQYGVTKTPEDSRKLGLLIGEGIAKAGVFSKADEVLEAIGNYTAQQTRMGMTSANVDGYASFLTGMMRSGIPGTDPSSAAAMMARVNTSISAGGNAGEAGQNFTYSAIGSRLGLDPLQTAILREQGAFGTGSKTFGKGSVYQQYMDAYGGKGNAPEVAGQSTATNLQLVMDRFEKIFAGRPELMANAMANYFGSSMSQSMALATVHKKHGSEALGGMADRLQRLGININDVNSSGLSRLGQIEADTSLSEEEKDKRTKEAATKNQEDTEGSRTRATINGVERAVQKFAGELIPVMNDVRGAVMYMAGEKSGSSPRQVMEAVARAESKDRVGLLHAEFDPAIDKAGQDISNIGGRKRGAQADRDRNWASWSPEQRDANAEKINKLTREEADVQARLNQLKKELADRLDAERRMLAQNVQALRTPTSINPAAADDWSKGGAGGGRGMVNPDRVNGAGHGGAPTLEKSSGAGLGSSDPLFSRTEHDQLFVEAGRAHGVDPRLLKAIASKESGFKAEIVSPANRDGSQDFGLMQHNSKYLAERGLDNGRWKDPRANVTAAAKLLKQNMALSGGNLREAVRRYNGSGSKAEAYADDVLGRYRALQSVGAAQVSGGLPAGATARPEPATPLPGATNRQNDAAKARAEPATPLPQEGEREAAAERRRLEELRVSGTFHLLDQRGLPAAAPVEMATSMALPRPSGSFA